MELGMTFILSQLSSAWDLEERCRQVLPQRCICYCLSFCCKWIGLFLACGLALVKEKTTGAQEVASLHLVRAVTTLRLVTLLTPHTPSALKNSTHVVWLLLFDWWLVVWLGVAGPCKGLNKIWVYTEGFQWLGWTVSSTSSCPRFSFFRFPLYNTRTTFLSN